MTQFYNLDAIIFIGYRVNSRGATQFRQRVTSVLQEYAIRGYVLDRKCMKNGTYLGELDAVSRLASSQSCDSNVFYLAGFIEAWGRNTLFSNCCFFAQNFLDFSPILPYLQSQSDYSSDNFCFQRYKFTAICLPANKKKVSFLYKCEQIGLQKYLYPLRQGIWSHEGSHGHLPISVPMLTKVILSSSSSRL